MFYLLWFIRTQVKHIQINARSLVGKKGVKVSRGMHSNDLCCVLQRYVQSHPKAKLFQGLNAQ